MKNYECIWIHIDNQIVLISTGNTIRKTSHYHPLLETIWNHTYYQKPTITQLRTKTQQAKTKVSPRKGKRVFTVMLNPVDVVARTHDLPALSLRDVSLPTAPRQRHAVLNRTEWGCRRWACFSSVYKGYKMERSLQVTTILLHHRQICLLGILVY
jgi:hypothetical protein